MFCVMAESLLKQFMNCRGVNAAPLLLISMVYVGGLLFSGQMLYGYGNLK